MTKVAKKVNHRSHSIQEVNWDKVGEAGFQKRLADCVILTQDHQILLKKRGPDEKPFPGYLTLFGGHVEPHESAKEAVARELKEELGAVVRFDELIDIGAITEAATQHSEVIHIYFWQDRDGLITGCCEGEPCYFDNIATILELPNVMDYAVWALRKCQKERLITT